MRCQFTPILIALVLLLTAPDAKASGGGGAAWPGKKVMVRDYTPDAWRPHVAAQVAAFNAAMPRRVPRLVYRPQPNRSCRQTPKREIIVCVDEGISTGGSAAFRLRQRQRTMAWARVRLRPWSEDIVYPGTLLCHELMHALTGIPDVMPRTRDEVSCVHGNVLQAPGSFDVAYAEKVYKKHHSGPRDRGRGKHR